MTATRRAPAKNSAKSEDKYVRDPFIYPVGEVNVVLPSLSFLKPGLIRRMRHMTQIDQLYTLLEENLNKDQLAAVDDMDPDEFEAMCKAWREHSGTDLGES